MWWLSEILGMRWFCVDTFFGSVFNLCVCFVLLLLFVCSYSRCDKQTEANFHNKTTQFPNESLILISKQCVSSRCLIWNEIDAIWNLIFCYIVVFVADDIKDTVDLYWAKAEAVDTFYLDGVSAIYESKWENDSYQ